MDADAAITEAQQLEREAAALSAEAHRKLARAAMLRSQHQGWLQQQLAAASAEVACWPPGWRARGDE